MTTTLTRSGVVAAISLLVVAAFGVPVDAAEEPALSPAVDPVYTFVSMPDFLNADIGDTRLRAGRGWDLGDPVSTSLAYERAIDVVLDEVEAEQPDGVFVAGDLVGGRWGKDPGETGIFGSVDTPTQRRKAVVRAGKLYYGEWVRRFEPRGLSVYPAVGDHDIGDNPWPVGEYKIRLFHAFKDVWARHFTDLPEQGSRFDMRPVGAPEEHTAYSTYLTPDVLLVTVDVFSRSKDGVTVTVRWGQLNWLREVLAQNTAGTVIVQGHAPVIGPVRKSRSSGLMLAQGAASKFWQTLTEFDVDLYLCGEVHDVTAIAPETGPVQISHGGHLAWGGANYLLGRLYADGRVEMALKRFAVLSQDTRRTLWQVQGTWMPTLVEYARGAPVTGTMTLSVEGSVLERSGELSPWDGL